MKHIGRYTFRLDLGKVRVNNEDNAATLINSHGDILLCVCDGMGGYKKGDFASRIVIDHLKNSFLNRSGFLNRFVAISWLTNTIKLANKEIFAYAQEEQYKDMGTTIVACLLVKNSIIICSAGDSRCYFYDSNNLQLMSKDQTYAEFLYSTGKIKKEEIKTHPQRHVLTNAIGIFPVPNFEINVFPYKEQSILLCSDGLYNNVSERDILSCVSTNEDIDDKAATLVALANANGGSDNIAVVIWEPKKC